MTPQTPTPLENELLERLEKVFMEYSRNFRKSEKDTEYAKKVLPILSSSIQAFLTELKEEISELWLDNPQDFDDDEVNKKVDKTASKHFGSLVNSPQPSPSSEKENVSAEATNLNENATEDTSNKSLVQGGDK